MHLVRLATVAALVIAVVPVQAAPDGAGGGEPPVTVRVEWGGGKPRAWMGTIRVVDGDAALRWQSLCRDADAAASIHAAGDTLHVHDSRPRDRNGVVCAIDGWSTGRIVARLAPVNEPQAVTEIDVAVVDLLAEESSRELDADGNRLTIGRPAADALRVVFADGSWPGGPGVHPPGGVVRFTVHPLLASRPGATAPRELTVRVRDLSAGADVRTETRLLHGRNDSVVPVAGGLVAQRFEPLAFEVALPDREAACEVVMEVIERSSMRWSRPVASRTFDVVAVADQPVPVAEAEWKLVYEFDPANPRMHERLRRMPGMGMPAIALPNVPLPSVRLPALPLPSMAPPGLPIPKMPNVPLPSVAALASRRSGLLLTGHGVVEPTSLGPMLQLPAASAVGEPAWEGIVVAGVEPGMPHLVEIEYPLDQDAVCGVNVLEANAAGTLVQSRYAGGFEVARPVAIRAEQQGQGRHSFVFWPSSRHPVVMISNPAARTPALFGKVRVFAGPARVPTMQAVGAKRADTEAGRGLHAYIPDPSGLVFGAGGGIDGAAARLAADWQSIVLGIRRSAEWLSAQGARGAMVGVYGQGGAIWPSRLTRGAPRWVGAAADPSAGLAEDDVLEAVCRIYHREGLRLVPAVVFDAPVPALEEIRWSVDDVAGSGLVLVGRDGRPRRLPGRSTAVHYNILDPRVQQAVADLVGELAARLGEAPAVDGVAIVLPHDGWLHLPGIAWGLDDATFARFAAEVGAPNAVAGADRHAQRAALVEGPLREQWLAWRGQQIAAFYQRLAAMVSAEHPRRSLYVAPTTLLAIGELAARFRPLLADGPSHDDLWREIGVDPLSIAGSGRVVFLSPHVHLPAGGLADRSAIENVNRSPGLARAAAGAGRRGAIAVEVPLEVSIKQLVPHGPFGAAVAEGAATVHAVRTGAAQTRAMAESLVAADAEVVFDMRLLFAQPTLEGVLADRAFSALPRQPLNLADPLPAPLVVRSTAGPGGTAMLLVNACDAPARAILTLAGNPSVVADAVDGARLAVDGDGRLAVPLEPWGVRSLVADVGVAVAETRVEFADDVRGWIAARLDDLRRRRAAIEAPVPMQVLDNPEFDLPDAGGAITGWELVEPRRGSLAVVADGRAEAGRALVFSSVTGLSTLRSNPFPPPATGRISVAAWLRLAEGDPQPPLRIAIEGLESDREYYRFAPVGGLSGGAPLGGEWSQFVLQIDDLPGDGLESLRVRLDLLGPGTVQIDGVRVFDLAFDEGQRVRLSRLITTLEQRLADGDVGGCAVALDSHWPRFLMAHVPGEPVASAVTAPEAAEGLGQPGGQPMARPPNKWKWR